MTNRETLIVDFVEFSKLVCEGMLHDKHEYYTAIPERLETLEVVKNKANELIADTDMQLFRYDTEDMPCCHAEIKFTGDHFDIPKGKAKLFGEICSMVDALEVYPSYDDGVTIRLEIRNVYERQHPSTRPNDVL